MVPKVGLISAATLQERTLMTHIRYALFLPQYLLGFLLMKNGIPNLFD